MRENRTLGLIFTEGSYGSLGSLCDSRTVGSIPFGARYRLIDFMLSSMTHADISDVGVFTRDKYESLMNHLGNGSDWDLARKSGGLVLLPPYLSPMGNTAYRGEIESLSTHRNYIKDSRARYVILADADVLGSIDVNAAIDQHITSNAHITVVCQKVDSAKDLGQHAIVFTEEKGRVNDVSIGAPFKGSCLRYLGIMIVEKKRLLDIIDELTAHNLFSISRDLLQKHHRHYDIKIFMTDGCVKIQTLEGYYNSNMALLKKEGRNALFNRASPVLTRVRDEPPVRYGETAVVKNSIIADGSVIDGTVENSIIFRQVNINKGAVVKDSIIMAKSVIAEDAHLSYVVCDRECYINKNRLITGASNYPVVIAKGSVV